MGVGDERCLAEVAAVFVAQTQSGFVPHMRYLGDPNYQRGPRQGASSLTQPPVYGIVLERLEAAGWQIPDDLIGRACLGIEYLWNRRRTADGLLAIYHPWESGADDSPRWDDWVGTSQWSRARFREVDQFLLQGVEFDDEQGARGSSRFVSCPAAFNAITAYAASCLARVTGSKRMREIADDLATSLDGLLWNPDENLWDDLPKQGGGAHQSTPTLDGVLGALTTNDPARAMAALHQVNDRERFGADYGLRYLPPSHPAYNPNDYWRGPAWPQMNYLIWLAARRWGLQDVAAQVREMSIRAAESSNFSEYWNPETGAGLGAIPQTWATIVTAIEDRFAPD